MFLGSLYTLLESINFITFKKACDYAEKFGYSGLGMLFVSQAAELPLYALAYFVLPLDLSFHFAFSDLTIQAIVAFFIIFACGVIDELIYQHTYANEKISVLAPYENLGSVFTIMFGVMFPFARGETSWWTVAIALCTAIVIVIVSIDFKNFTFNRFCALMGLNGIAVGVANIATIWLLLEFTPITIIITKGILTLMVAFVGFLMMSNRFSLTEKRTHTLFGYFLVNNAVWGIKTICIYMFMVSTGLLMATLLGMVQFAMTLVFSYFFFHDIPSKKNIFLGIFVTVAVVAGLGV